MIRFVESHKKIFADTAKILTGEVVDKGLRFLIVMIIVRILDKETYGMYVLLFSVMELTVGFLDFNLFQAVVRYINIVKEKKDKLKIIINSYLIEFIVGIISFIFLYIVVALGVVFKLVPTANQFWMVIFFMAVYTFSFPLLRNGQAVLQATSKFSILGIYKCCSSFILVILLSAAFFNLVEGELSYIIASRALSVAIIFALGLFLTYHLFFSKHGGDARELLRSYLSRRWQKKLLSFSFYPFIQGCLSILWRRIDFFLLAYFLTASDVGVFRNGILLIPMLGMIFSSFSSVIFPRIVNKYGRGEEESLRKNNEFYISMLFTILLPTVAILSYFSELIIRVVFTDKYIASADVFKYAVLVCPFVIVNSIGVNWVIAMGRQKYWALAVLVALFCTVLLDVILIPKYGIMGAMITYIICNGILFLYISFVVTRLTKSIYWHNSNIVNILFFVSYILFNHYVQNKDGTALIFYIVLISAISLFISFRSWSLRRIMVDEK